MIDATELTEMIRAEMEGNPEPEVSEEAALTALHVLTGRAGTPLLSVA